MAQQKVKGSQLDLAGQNGTDGEALFGMSLPTLSSGNAQIRLGCDTLNNDIEIGSANPAITDIGFWNVGTSTYMDITFKDATAQGKITSQATVGGDAATTLTTKGYVDAKLSANVFTTTIAANPGGAAGTYAHGLGAVPDLFQVQAVNITAELGYAAGEVVPLNNLIHDNDEGSGTTTNGHIFSANATNVYFGLSNNFRIVNKGSPGSNAAVATPARWNITIKAIKF